MREPVHCEAEELLTPWSQQNCLALMNDVFISVCLNHSLSLKHSEKLVVRLPPGAIRAVWSIDNLAENDAATSAATECFGYLVCFTVASVWHPSSVT